MATVEFEYTIYFPEKKDCNAMTQNLIYHSKRNSFSMKKKTPAAAVNALEAESDCEPSVKFQLLGGSEIIF